MNQSKVSSLLKGVWSPSPSRVSPLSLTLSPVTQACLTETPLLSPQSNARDGAIGTPPAAPSPTSFAWPSLYPCEPQVPCPSGEPTAPELLLPGNLLQRDLLLTPFLEGRDLVALSATTRALRAWGLQLPHVTLGEPMAYLRERLHAMERLTSVFLKPPDYADYAPLLSIVEGLPVLRRLDLGWLGVGCYEMDALARAMEAGRLSGLRSLKLRLSSLEYPGGCQRAERDVPEVEVRLALALTSCPLLEELTLFGRARDCFKETLVAVVSGGGLPSLRALRVWGLRSRGKAGPMSTHDLRLPLEHLELRACPNLSRLELRKHRFRTADDMMILAAAIGEGDLPSLRHLVLSQVLSIAANGAQQVTWCCTQNLCRQQRRKPIRHLSPSAGKAVSLMGLKTDLFFFVSQVTYMGLSFAPILEALQAPGAPRLETLDVSDIRGHVDFVEGAFWSALERACQAGALHGLTRLDLSDHEMDEFHMFTLADLIGRRRCFGRLGALVLGGRNWAPVGGQEDVFLREALQEAGLPPTAIVRDAPACRWLD
jgi:hypothetical protein